jgi:hypothetical protein
MGLLDNISSAYGTAKSAVKSNYEAAVNSAKTPNAPNLWTPRGKTSALDDGKYDIKNHSYPNDLMAADSRYGGSYVMFYINVATDSKLFKKGDVATVDDYPPRDRGDLIGQNMSKQGLVGANAATALVEGIAAGGIAGGVKGATAGAGAAAVASVGVGVAATMAPDAKRSQKRLKTAIALHVPNQLSVRYGVQWSDDDTSALAMANAGGTEILKAISGDKKSDVTGVGASIIANIALAKGPNAAGNSAALGIAANPKKEQVFKGVDFRTFSFEYQFFPRDVDEANNVLRIIEEFKYHMHPEFKDTNNFVYIYPSEFDIMYFVNGKENKKLHRHTSCVLTDLNINYTPNGLFTTFPNGMPTQINMSLSFRELALLTKDKVKDGL